MVARKRLAPANCLKLSGMTITPPHHVGLPLGIGESSPPRCRLVTVGGLDLWRRDHPEAPALLDEETTEGVAGSDERRHKGDLTVRMVSSIHRIWRRATLGIHDSLGHLAELDVETL
jgi:hypothetical protein